ncbi:MAG: hypothetical protein ACFFEF_00275 [Candidatus Thorarchaeota archaeon]
MNDDEMNDVRQLIDLMQSQLVELFDQLRELRERLNLLSESSTDGDSSILPLFAEVKKTSRKSESSTDLEIDTSSEDAITNNEDFGASPNNHSPPPPEHVDVSPVDSHDSVSDTIDSTAVSAKVSRVLDPISRELRTGEATADIIMEYLQSAKEYLIDEDERKKKVARDMDIVLNFLKARGKRGIRSEERDNILKRIRRWKAHLVSYSDSPAE